MAGSVWKGHLTFGLVSLPVKLTVAARSETVSFNQLHKDDHSRVKMVTFCQAEDKQVARSELVKGYEYEKDRYVVIDEEDIRKITPKTARVMEILEFVKAEEVDPLYLETSYYVQPEEAGEKPYSLLFEAMRRTGYVSLARLMMHNREHIVVLRPGKHGLILHTLYYRDEVRATEEFRTDTTQVKEKEVDMAVHLLEALAASFEVEKYKDTYRETLRGMIEAKIQGAEIVEAPQAEPLAPVVDIMEALKNSLAQLKKPPVKVTEMAAPSQQVATGSDAEGKQQRGVARRA